MWPKRTPPSCSTASTIRGASPSSRSGAAVSSGARVAGVTRESVDRGDEIRQVERLHEIRDAAGVNEVERAIARVARGDERRGAEMRIERGRQLEEFVAPLVGDAQVDDHRVERLAPEQRLRGFRGFG